MDTAAKIATEALRLWKEDCLTIPEAIRLARESIQASPAAQDRASRIVWATVPRLRARREAAILTLAEFLGGGQDLAEDIDAWVESHRMVKRCRAAGREPSEVVRSAVANIESAIADRLSPEVRRKFSARLEME